MLRTNVFRAGRVIYDDVRDTISTRFFSNCRSSLLGTFPPSHSKSTQIPHSILSSTVLVAPKYPLPTPSWILMLQDPALLRGPTLLSGPQTYLLSYAAPDRLPLVAANRPICFSKCYERLCFATGPRLQERGRL